LLTAALFCTACFGQAAFAAASSISSRAIDNAVVRALKAEGLI
jgi:hypothetical protein